jgi:hypothetical protein
MVARAVEQEADKQRAEYNRTEDVSIIPIQGRSGIRRSLVSHLNALRITMQL